MNYSYILRLKKYSRLWEKLLYKVVGHKTCYIVINGFVLYSIYCCWIYEIPVLMEFNVTRWYESQIELAWFPKIMTYEGNACINTIMHDQWKISDCAKYLRIIMNFILHTNFHDKLIIWVHLKTLVQQKLLSIIFMYINE